MIDRLGPGDEARIVAAAHLFDAVPTVEWASQFLRREGHHMWFARVDGVDAGFVTGIEITHPDKGTEMLVYELGVDEAYRRRGLATALLAALRASAEELGCSGMWVPVDDDNEVAKATYRASGADDPEPVAVFTWTF